MKVKKIDGSHYTVLTQKELTKLLENGGDKPEAKGSTEIALEGDVVVDRWSVDGQPRDEDFELLYCAEIFGNLIFKDVHFPKNLNLDYIGVTGSVIFDNVIVDGSIVYGEASIKKIVIKKLEVKKGYTFTFDEMTDSYE